MICIPFAPPITHFILPQMWGSGVKGAKPRVSTKTMANFKFLYPFFCIALLTFFHQKIFFYKISMQFLCNSIVPSASKPFSNLETTTLEVFSSLAICLVRFLNFESACSLLRI